MPQTRPAHEASLKVTPYLVVRDADRAIEFYKHAFDAVEQYRLTEPGGKIGHAELCIGSSILMLSDEYADFGALAPISIGGTPVRFHVQVADADACVRRAIEAGALELRPVKDQMHGERSGLIADPFGHQWFIATPIGDVSPKEMQRRFTESLTAAG